MPKRPKINCRECLDTGFSDFLSVPCPACTGSPQPKPTVVVVWWEPAYSDMTGPAASLSEVQRPSPHSHYPIGPGWYWMPKGTGDARGPFPTQRAAWKDAKEEGF